MHFRLGWIAKSFCALVVAALIVLPIFTVTAAPASAAGSGFVTMEQFINTNMFPSPATPQFAVGETIPLAVYISDNTSGCTDSHVCTTPTGTLHVYDEAGTVLLDATLQETGTGQSNLNTNVINDLPAGHHTLHIDYSGDANFEFYAGNFPIIVDPGTPTIDFSQSSSTSRVGDAVTFTAHATSPSGITPTGTIEFEYGSSDITAPVALDSSGTATFTTTSLPLDPAPLHTYFGHYSGDGNFVAADSISIEHDVDPPPVATSTSVTVDPITVRADDKDFIDAHVTGADGTPGVGTLQFVVLSGATPVITYTEATPENVEPNYSDFQDVIEPNTLGAGTYTIRADFTPSSSGQLASSGEATLTVGPAVAEAGATVAVTATPTASTFGVSVDFHVVANPPATDEEQDDVTGTVDLSVNGSTALGSCDLTSYGIGSETSCDLVTTKLAANSDLVTANLEPTARWLAASGTTTVLVTETSTTSLAADPTATAPGNAVTLSAHVSPQDPSGAHPTGTIVFRAGTTALGSAAVDASGDAQLTTSGLALGTTAIVASYSGDNVVGASTSGPVDITVTSPPKAPTTPVIPTAGAGHMQSQGSVGQPSAAPAVTSSSPAPASALALTGFNLAAYLGLAGALVVAGIGLFLLVPRRRRRAVP